jgi:predicted nucleotidyltransferase
MGGEPMNAAVNAEEVLRLPNDTEVGQILQRFAKGVREHYGPLFAGLYLYGSRARGEHAPGSDADVAVILSGNFNFWLEVGVLSDLSYDYLVEQGVVIDAKPLSLEAWNDPSSHANPPLVRAVRRDCKVIGTAS